MLPCYKTCPNRSEGCHKTCLQWAEYQVQQAKQRQLQKNYLKYYTELCGLRTWQFQSIIRTQL